MARESSLDSLFHELYRLLENLRVWPISRSTAQVTSFLRVHAADLTDIVTAQRSWSLLWRAASVSNADIVLALFEAGARPDESKDLYSVILRHRHIYGLNGVELDDESIARRLRVMHDTHGLRLPPSGYISDATPACIRFDRLECLRVMIEIDPQARGYTELGQETLLNLASKFHNPRMVRFLMANGWSLETHDLNESPVGTCMEGACYKDTSLEDAMCTTLAILLEHVTDAPALLRISGLCDAAGVPALYLTMPTEAVARMHVYMCAAAHAHSSLPRSLLNVGCETWHVFNANISPSILRSLHLEEHMHIGIGDSIYLRDSLRIASSFNSAARLAAAVDALIIVEAFARTRRASLPVESTCMEVLADGREPAVTGASPTLRCWAWMRRLHAVTARQHMLRREVACRRGMKSRR